jgi:hypothetical protein
LGGIGLVSPLCQFIALLIHRTGNVVLMVGTTTVQVLPRKQKISLDSESKLIFYTLKLVGFKTGVLGFEPRNVETKTRCLTTWRHPIAFA